ncbi:MAG: homocysteine S-methyltransferase family protein [Thermoleophilia bacterium]
MDLLDLMAQRTLLLDGAMGTELMRRGFRPGECPEEWSVTRRDDVVAIHREYFAAGSDIVNTNTFGGNRLKLDSFGVGDRVVEINTAAAQLALGLRDREYAGRFVAGNIGPSGHLLEPMGDTDPETVAAAFREQAETLIAAGVDLINIETMFDLTEARLAVEAARAAAGERPVLASMAFAAASKGYRTMMGVDPSAAVATLREAGATLVGCNCEISAEAMNALVPILADLNGGFTYTQPNAGQPRLVGGVTVYEETAEHFAAVVSGFVAHGAGIVGGCCGTTPAFITALAAALGRARSI